MRGALLTPVEEYMLTLVTRETVEGHCGVRETQDDDPADIWNTQVVPNELVNIHLLYMLNFCSVHTSMFMSRNSYLLCHNP